MKRAAAEIDGDARRSPRTQRPASSSSSQWLGTPAALGSFGQHPGKAMLASVAMSFWKSLASPLADRESHPCRS